VGVRLGVPAAAPRQLIAVVAAALAIGAFAQTAAVAAPKTGHARADFERGVKAYQKQDYKTAAEAFSASYDAEADTETMFAWAQTERQLGRCDTAIDLYNRLLAGSLQAANREAIEKAKTECRELLAAMVGKPGGKPEHVPTGSDERDSGDTTDAGTGSAGDDTVTVEQPVTVTRRAHVDHQWWQDPVGDTLTGFGVAGLVLAATFDIESQSRYAAASNVSTEKEYDSELARANTDRSIAIATGVGGGLALGIGISWYVLHHGDEEPKRHHALSGWIGNGGVGMVVGGAW
jgi:tetratricopeptide (TPR) repeat protein